MMYSTVQASHMLLAHDNRLLVVLWNLFLLRQVKPSSFHPLEFSSLSFQNLSSSSGFIHGEIFHYCFRFSGDTCSALDGFQKNPYNNSLSSILPCDELLSAQPVLSDFGEGIYNLVNEVSLIHYA